MSRALTRAAPGRLGAATAAAVAGVAALTLVAGCGSDGGGPAPTSSAPTTSAAPSSSTPEPSGSTSVPPSGSPTPTASGSSSTTTTPTTTTPALAICAQLDVAVTRVPGAAGITYGLISVTNRGSARCSLPGVPAVRLLDANRSPVTAAATAAGTTTALALEPGAVASTLLADRSDSCQANTRSVYAEVTATVDAPTVVAALALPPCSLSVKPFVAGTSPSP